MHTLVALIVCVLDFNNGFTIQFMYIISDVFTNFPITFTSNAYICANSFEAMDNLTTLATKIMDLQRHGVRIRTTYNDLQTATFKNSCIICGF